MNYEIDYDVLAALATRTHPLLNIADDWHQQVLETPEAWIGEVLFQARSVYHLLDMAQIPQGRGYSSDLDSRTYLAVMELIDLRKQVE